MESCRTSKLVPRSKYIDCYLYIHDSNSWDSAKGLAALNLNARRCLGHKVIGERGGFSRICFHQELSGPGRDRDASRFLVAFLSLAIEPSNISERRLAKSDGSTYLLLPRVANILIRIEEGANVDCLPFPHMSVDSPV
jgi:hypothetical protein